MRNWTMAALPLALALTVTACSAEVTSDGKRTVEAGPTTTQSFDLKGFTGVKVAGPDDVTIRQGDAFSITAKGPKGEIDELEIKLDGDVLSITAPVEGIIYAEKSGKVTVVAVGATATVVAAVEVNLPVFDDNNAGSSDWEEWN